MSDIDNDTPAKKRFVFRLTVPTIKLLRAYCQGRLHGQQSRTIRKALELFNQGNDTDVHVRTWKLNSPRGAGTVSVWAPVDLIDQANDRAATYNMSLNHYVEMAIRAMLVVK